MHPARSDACFTSKEKLAHTSLKFSPINPNLVAVSSAANFGVVGKGVAQIKSMEPGGQLKTIATSEEKVSSLIIDRTQYSTCPGMNSMSTLFWWVAATAW